MVGKRVGLTPPQLEPPLEAISQGIQHQARTKLALDRDVDQLLLARYVRACVIIDDRLDVVQFRGWTGPYLEHPTERRQVNVHAAELQRDTFISSVSDALRMPLSRILLWVDVLRGLDHRDPQVSTAVETIADCASRGALLPAQVSEP